MIKIEEVLSKLSNVTKNGSGYKARCPSHDDKTPSLSIKLGDAGNVLLFCHAGCKIDEISAAIEVKVGELFPTKSKPITKSRIVATYDYRNENRDVLYQKVRYDPKKFEHRKPDGDGGWIWKLGDVRRVPFRLPELLEGLREGSPIVCLCEGEKDAITVSQLGYIATNLKDWRNEFTGFLQNCHVRIIRDHDSAGVKLAERAAHLIKGNVKSVTVIDPFDGQPMPKDHGPDISDWIALGNSTKEFDVLLTGKDELDSDSELPKNYFQNERGIFYSGVNKNGEPTKTFVCSPLRVTAKTCDADNESWGRRLQFEDARHVKHDLVIPMSLLSGDGSELRSRLMDCGLIIDSGSDPRQKFLQFILRAEPKKHIRCVNQTGWHDGAFVLPDEVISSNGNRDSLLLQNIDRAANKFKTSGTLADWQENIARYCVGNSRLMFAVSTAFAAALLPIAEETGGGFHLIGTSSTGKTTALFVAGSVWGGRSNKGFLDTWKSTGNGLEAVAELHNHSLLLLDEINEVNAHEVGEIVYALSNGFGKSRMNKNTTARRKAEWNLMFFSSGEETLEQKMQSVGQRTRGGQQARFVNIEADAGKGFGLYEYLHGFESANALADHLSAMSRKFYGTAIREFLKAVCSNRKLVEARIKESRQMFQSKLRLQDASGEVFRVAARFSLVTVAGILATEFGITKWNTADVIACGERLFSEWLDTRGTTGSYDTEQGVKQVLSFIAQHGSSRFQSFEKKRDCYGNELSERIQNRAGFKRDCPNGQVEYLILREIFDREICNGFSSGAIAKELDQRGYLRRGTEKDSLQSKIQLPELGRKRVYVIVSEGLDGEREQET